MEEFLCRTHFHGIAIWKGEYCCWEIVEAFLTDKQLRMFKKSPFGAFYKLGLTLSGPLLHCILMCKVRSDFSSCMRFVIREQEYIFSKTDFELITGLQCSESRGFVNLSNTRSRLFRTYFKNLKSVNGKDLKSFMQKNTVCDNDDDAVMLAQLYALEFCLLGKRIDTNVDEKNCIIIEYGSLFLESALGDLVFDETIKSLQSALPSIKRIPNQEADLMQDEINKKNPKQQGVKYCLSGFPVTFQVWAFENISFLKKNATFSEKKGPRMLCWNPKKQPYYETLRKDFFEYKKPDRLNDVALKRKKSFEDRNNSKRCKPSPIQSGFADMVEKKFDQVMKYLKCVEKNQKKSMADLNQKVDQIFSILQEKRDNKGQNNTDNVKVPSDDESTKSTLHHSSTGDDFK